jgi:hypothetical protein
MILSLCYIQPGLIFIPCRAQPRMDSIPNFISKLDRLSIHSSFLLEPHHHSIPQNQLNCSLAERKQIADRGSLCRMHLRKPPFRHTDSSPSWTHKSDSLPNFGVNTCPFNCGIKVILFRNRLQPPTSLNRICSTPILFLRNPPESSSRSKP